MHDLLWNSNFEFSMKNSSKWKFQVCFFFDKKKKLTITYFFHRFPDPHWKMWPKYQNSAKFFHFHCPSKISYVLIWEIFSGVFSTFFLMVICLANVCMIPWNKNSPQFFKQSAKKMSRNGQTFTFPKSSFSGQNLHFRHENSIISNCL